MFDHIFRNATLPGAVVNAISVAKQRDQEEKRRNGTSKIDETAQSEPKSSGGGVWSWLLSALLRGSSKSGT